MDVPKNIPRDLSGLFLVMAPDFSAILCDNLVGIYLWGALTYHAFDETCSDVDCIVVTRRDLDDREFSELDEWFKETGKHNRWVNRIEIRFVIDNEFLDKTSRCLRLLSLHGETRPPWIGRNPNYLDEHRTVRHHAVGRGREAHRSASIRPMLQ